MRPLDSPWGGGNWWLTQTVAATCVDTATTSASTSARAPAGIVLVDPRVGGNVVLRRRADRALTAHARVLHRINECDLRKGTNEIDALLADANRVADHTVFISAWLRDYHAERWFDLARPHSVIPTGPMTTSSTRAAAPNGAGRADCASSRTTGRTTR